MRLRSFALVLLVLTVSLSLRAEDCRSDHFDQIRGYPVEIEASGNRLWIADGAGLSEVDVSDRLAPALVQRTFEEAPSIALEVLNDDRVALLTTNRLLVYDVSGHVPSLIDEVEAAGRAVHRLGSDLVVLGGSLVPFEWTGEILLPGSETGLDANPTSSAVVGDLLLVSIPGVGTLVFDEELQRRGRVTVVADTIVGNGAIAYLGRGDGVFAVDLTDPDDPVVVGTAGGEIGASVLQLEGDRLFATNGNGTVRVIDVSRPDSMAVIGSVMADIDVMAIAGGYLYSYGFGRDRFGTRFEHGPYVVVRDPESTELGVLGAVGESTGPLRDVATDGTVAWLADPPYVRAVELQTGEELWRLGIEEPFDRIRFENGRLILYGATWVHLVDPHPDFPRILGKWPTLGTPGGGVTFSGHWLIEANRSSGFHVLDVSVPSNIVQRGGLINDGRGQWMEVVGIPGAVYGIVNTGVKVVALGSDPKAVEIVDFLTFGKPVDVEIATLGGQHYLVVLDGSRLHVHALTDPLHPIVIATVEVGQAKKIAVAGETVAVLGTDARITRVDLGAPSSPVILGTVEGMREGLSIAAADDIIVGADRWALWSVPLTGAEDTEAPSVLVIEEDGKSVTIAWDPPALHETQIQIASDPLFEDVRQDTIIRGGNVRIEKVRNDRWIRVRFRTGCDASAWSSTLRIAAEVSRGRAVRRP